MITNKIVTPIDDTVRKFSNELGGVVPDFIIKSRPDGDYLLFEFSEPGKRFYDALSKVDESLANDHPFKDKITISKRIRKPVNLLNLPETALLQRELSASLTIDQNSFGEEFLSRYTPSATMLEKQIIVDANHVVYGRRGSGKSSLLAYSMHHLRLAGTPYCWVAMQTYAGRSDAQVIASVLGEIFAQVAAFSKSKPDFIKLSRELEKFGESDDNLINEKIQRLIPRMRRMLESVLYGSRVLTIFLDDVHVLAHELQPELLSVIYSLSRGNKTFT